MLVTLGNMRAMQRIITSDITPTFDISPIIGRTYKFRTKQLLIKCAKGKASDQPEMYRLLYIGFNAFDKKSGRIDFDDHTSKADGRLRIRTTERSITAREVISFESTTYGWI
ncbi:hypothetical protein [Gimesia sp.]|uniref:hypothetical protein n=1 Tax=Gimesia sp. TaxID=2024833 RepID=UPI003A8E9017